MSSASPQISSLLEGSSWYHRIYSKMTFKNLHFIYKEHNITIITWYFLLILCLFDFFRWIRIKHLRTKPTRNWWSCLNKQIKLITSESYPSRENWKFRMRSRIWDALCWSWHRNVETGNPTRSHAADTRCAPYPGDNTFQQKILKKSRKNIDLDVVASLRSCALQC